MPEEADPHHHRVRRALDEFLDRLAHLVARELPKPEQISHPMTEIPTSNPPIVRVSEGDNA
ncbi:MAG TPA: hypothetical protein VG097_11220 [Gemmata sp.]|jgi:hypothetical protein|nr:hypothetical protein [Gemmata sp.]